MKVKKYIITGFLLALLSLTCLCENPKIRVGINFGTTAIDKEVSFTSPYGFQAGYLDDDGLFFPIMFFSDTEASVCVSGDGLEILDNRGDTLFDASDEASLAIYPLDNEEDEYYDEDYDEDYEDEEYKDEGAAYIPHIQIGSVKYPEILKFENTNDKITIINIVDSEVYFKGVLPSEVYPSWHEEALKAAAVATRTYTYHSMSGKHSSYGVDLCTTTCCQVYSGVTRCQESTNRAVEDTENLVMTYDGKLITAVYHAISGGITETAAGAWGGNPENYPYLTIVKTPFEEYEGLSNGHWQKVLYEKDFEELIADSSYVDKIGSNITSIEIDDDTPGYLNNVKLTDDDDNSILLKTSSSVRSFFNTLSSNFTIAPVLMPNDDGDESVTVLTSDGEYEIDSGDEIVYLSGDGEEMAEGLKRAYFIDGKGYGHGVGLSQYGAQFAAKAGYSYDEILLTYYPGVDFEDYRDFLENNED